MYIVNMETENYSWYALGRTEKDAKEAILDKWNERADKMTRMGRPIKICRNVKDLSNRAGILGYL